MDALRSVQLLRKYSKCKDCGNEKVSNGEGTVEIKNNTFKRTCKCGWMVKITEN